MSSGIHNYNKNDLRYLIMPRFGRDLQKLFEENGKKFDRELIAQIATKMLYAIEYMHRRRYAHADIKVCAHELCDETLTLFRGQTSYLGTKSSQAKKKSCF